VLRSQPCGRVSRLERTGVAELKDPQGAGYQPSPGKKIPPTIREVRSWEDTPFGRQT
jgi:hypothetical protein